MPSPMALRKLFMKLFIIFLFSTLFSSCASHLITSRQISIDDFNDQNSHRVGRIIFRDDSTYVGRDFDLGSSRISWIDTVTHELHDTPISDVKRIVFVKRGKGAEYGAAFGALSGILILGVVYLASADWESVFVPDKTLVFTIVSPFAVIGGSGIGLIVGTIIGFEDKYEFKP